MKTGIYLLAGIFPLALSAQIYTGTGSVTQGFGSISNSNIYSCPNGRTPALGSISGSGGQTWNLPAEVNFLNPLFPEAPDLHNPCNGATYANVNAALAALNGSEIINIDPDGELITAFVFADNYFEMYVKGVPVGRDKAPYTQFNSSLLRFRVKRPFTIAMLLVDLEEHLGLGTEANGPAPYHAGDGGMVAVFRDESGTIIARTGSNWKAQTYYIAPVKDLSCPVENGNQRLSGTCNTQDGTDGSGWYGLHWPRPDSWFADDFDASSWPSALEYSNAEVGVNNKPAYTNFTSIFDQPGADAAFIWSSNLILDNEVLVQYKVPSLASNRPPEESRILIRQVGESLILSDQQGRTPGFLEELALMEVSGKMLRFGNLGEGRMSTAGLPSGFYLLRWKTNGKTFYRKVQW
jgi:hypothetical protein